MSEEPGEYNLGGKRRLNGWQRLWVVASVLWVVFWIGAALNWVVVERHDFSNQDVGIFTLFLIAPLGVYVLVSVARRIALWVIEGFRNV